MADANLTRFIASVSSSQRIAPSRLRRPVCLVDLESQPTSGKSVAHFADVRADWGSGPALEHPNQMPGARFFPNARLNFAENLLRFRDDQPALIFRNERGTRREISYDSSTTR